MAWQDWQDRGEDWKQVYEGIGPVVQDVAAAYGAQVAPWRWDEPSISLTWERAGLHRKVKITIEGDPGGYRLRLSGGIWKDVPAPDGRTRHYAHLADLGMVSLGHPEDALTQRKRVLSALTKAASRVESTHRTEGEVFLPPRPSVL